MCFKNCYYLINCYMPKAPIPLCRSRYDLSISSGRAGSGKMKPIWTMIFKSAWWENIQLSTAHRHEVVQVGSESGSAMPCPCYRGVPDLNTLIPLCLRHHYALPACLTINFHREDRREILNMFKISRRSEEMPAPTRSHNAVFTMPPIANDPCTLSPIYPDLLDRDRSGPRSA